MNQNTLPHFPIAAVAIAILVLFADAGFVQSQTPIRPSAAAQSGSTSSSARRTSTSAGSSYSAGPRQYRSNTVLGDAVIQIDPESRSLVIVSDEDTHTEIMKVIKNLDRPKPQVLIKVLFVEVTYNKGLDLGIEGSYTLKVGNPLLSNSSGAIGSAVQTINSILSSGSSVTNTTTPVFPSNAGAATAASSFGLAQQTPTGALISVLTSDYQATLRALATKGNVNVLSRPSIMARNNQEAVIIVGQEVPFVTNSQITNNGQTINTIQYNDVGIILRVTPFITSNRSVEMIVAPEISTVADSTVTISPGVNSPIINKRSAETVVVTPDATTVVIGGLMQTQKTETLQKVPLLGDIPLLGLPFRHIVKGTTKQELIIFLTPYIVDSPQEFKDVTVSEANRSELVPDAFTPQEITNNMDTLKLIPDNEGKLPEHPETRRATPFGPPKKQHKTFQQQPDTQEVHP